MLQHLTDDVEWYVVFTQAKYPHWIFNVVDKNIGHVYAVRSLNDYQWLVVQPRTNITETIIMLKCQYPTINQLVDSSDKVVKVKVKQSEKVRGGLNWFTCVEQIKALLGISDFFTFTPKQLYNGLMGGKYGTGEKSS
jgi:hypothetical protein